MSNLMNNYTLWIIYINIVLYATCFQIQRPLEPFLVGKLMGDNNEYARLQSFFSLLQTAGSLISGRLLDLLGIKGGFLVSFGASALCYLLLSQSTDLSILYVSKIPAIFQAGFLCAQAAISQITEDGPERVRALGLLTFSYTIGSIIGPTVGGFLGASGDYYLGAKLAVAGSILSMILTLFMDSNHQKPSKGVENASKGEGSSTKSGPNYWQIIQAVWLLLATKVISSVANSMSASIFPVVLKDVFGLHEKGVGISMSVMSACNAVVSGFLLEPIVRMLGGVLSQAIYACIVWMTVLSSFQGVLVLPNVTDHSPAHGLYQYLLTAFALSIVQYVLATATTGESTSRVSDEEKGTLLGMEHSLFAAARVATPQLGNQIFERGGVAAVSFACAAIYGIITLMWGTFDLKPAKIEVNTERKEK
mmetsp:Transcript_22958/g.25126  ORF Transcript_22958/g.25126 Transcript_22958/m.25126 type:complete len:420 (+) Transcript_22958:25-1284(+)|eukprot:gene534-569_t